jgi:hypothetical protein
MDIVPELEITTSDPAFFEALSNPDGLLPHLEQAMHAIMTEFVARAEVPAPESEANRPGRVDRDGRPMGYYERGRGWWYPVMNRDQLGPVKELTGVIGPHLKAPHTMGLRMLRAKGLNAAGYKLQETSEQMEENWHAEVTTENGEVFGELTNFARYSSLVQGYDQIDLHKRRNWQTVEDTWRSNEMQAAVTAETAKAIDNYYHLT